jgi:hypothetical protein
MKPLFAFQQEDPRPHSQVSHLSLLLSHSHFHLLSFLGRSGPKDERGARLLMRVLVSNSG